MIKLFRFVLFLLVLAHFSTLFSEIIYTDPLDNAKYVSINNSIIIGLDRQINPSVKNDNSSVIVTGSKSGTHTGKIILAENGRKLIFKPDRLFEIDERVTVIIDIEKHFRGEFRIAKTELSFHTQRSVIKFNKDLIADKNSSSYLFKNDFPPVPFQFGSIPEITVTNNNPTDGKIFMSNFPFSNIPNTPFLLMLNNNGSVYTAIRMRDNAADFKKSDRGHLTYFSDEAEKFFEMDVNYNIIDSFYCGNGYSTDIHELVLLSNSHALLMSYDAQLVDMSAIVTGGNPNARVIGLIIQEIDENKNVVFQWRSWDHIPITDARHQDLTSAAIDYVHGNAIEHDNDGNILISSRHLDEITKISRTTGDIIWRLGGTQNQFSFPNDPGKFNYQHGIRRLTNGNIILFDNGNFHTPPHSRAVEYSLDETNKIATMVWQYRNNPDIFGFAMGFAQRLSNGNTFISWGSTNPSATEVTPDGNIVQEISLPAGVFSYRTFKYDWEGSPVYIDTLKNILPLKYQLSQNYPNPFNPKTTINFEIPAYTKVNLSIYDYLGRLVTTLVDKELNFGPYNVEFTSNKLSSGVYFYRLSTESFTETRKMVIVK
ncbi:MAG TPA: aryl-sulfate sulfotransferase [Ignavibacteria bacterium]|nr:aryl-sulfate sulfotransferase [Ignavibacteria bacterium]HMQ98512.1 aryl-sulfate sulfotransferase [Ignavibacteria bacterium]